MSWYLIFASHFSWWTVWNISRYLTEKNNTLKAVTVLYFNVPGYHFKDSKVLSLFNISLNHLGLVLFYTIMFLSVFVADHERYLNPFATISLRGTCNLITIEWLKSIHHACSVSGQSCLSSVVNFNPLYAEFLGLGETKQNIIIFSITYRTS